MSKSKEQFMQHRERTRNLECERIRAQMDVEARFKAALKSESSNGLQLNLVRLINDKF